MTQIFISHATEEDDFVNRLCQDLQAAGLVVWVDHQQIKAGMNWDIAVEKGINDSQSLLFVVTENSLKSEICADEWSHALSRNQMVIPIMLAKDLNEENLPFRLKRKQWIDFRDDYANALGKLVEALLGEVPVHALPVPPLETPPKASVSKTVRDIYISHRVESKTIATQLEDALTARFGAERVHRNDTRFIDRSALFLVIIGPKWAHTTDLDGHLRLEKPEDFLRFEIATALRQNKFLIPILVEGATMPYAEDLPVGLKELAYHESFTINDPKDIERLMVVMQEILG